MTISQDFKDALAINKAEDESFFPLIEKFEELKTVLDSNFEVKQKNRNWYGKVTKTTKPLLSLSLEDVITHKTGKYLYIRINGCGYVMGLGEIGELKDKLYFIGTQYYSNSKDKTTVYITNGFTFTQDYSLEDKITCVQLFSKLIKDYKQYLKETK